MRVPIRIIGIATTIFWIFLILFFVSAVYSVKDVQFDFGEPQISADSDNKLIFSLPVTVVNNGFYDIGTFRIVTEILDERGARITRGSTSVPIIRRNREVTLTHNMTIDIEKLLHRNQNFLFDDAELRILETVGMKIAEVVPIQASANLSAPWGAPLYGFTLGQVAYAAHNSTHLRVTVPMSFENHAFFDLVGDIQVRMVSSADSVIGEGQTSIQVYQNFPFNGDLQLYVSMADVTSSGYFEFNLSTPFFSYGPWRTPYG
jgi:hypothetical protein